MEEIETYIKESIDETLGLKIPYESLKLKLRASEELRFRIRDQYNALLSKLKQKDELIEQNKAEATMNAVALKKFVEENQKLAAECGNLLSECKKWERECGLYEQDRDALMDFGNEADERAKDAELRVRQLEEELEELNQRLRVYEQGQTPLEDDSVAVGKDTEENLLASVLETIVAKDEILLGHAFLEANCENNACRKLLEMWNSLTPSTQCALSQAAKVKALENDKDHLRMNLNRAEEEVNLLSKQNDILDLENKRLLKLYREHIPHGSGGKHVGSAPAKTNKRKSSPRRSSAEKKIDARQPLSPLEHNSPCSRVLEY